MPTLKVPDPTTGAWVKVAGAWLDAPRDGMTYARKDGTWSQVVLGNYVAKAGDTMTGPLLLSGDPTAALGAVTKQYSDGKVAKTGDTMTGTLALAPPTGTVTQNWYAATGPANKKTGTVRLQTDGSFVFCLVNDAGNYAAGLYVNANDSITTLPGGHTVWHRGNDGSGSGLDADLLDGYNADAAANGSTIALRDGSGMSDFQIIRVWQYVNTPKLVGAAENCGALGTPWGYQVRFHWDGGSLFYFSGNNGGWQQLSVGGNMSAGMAVNWGWAKIGPIVLQWVMPSVADDSYIGISLPIAYPNNITSVQVTPAAAYGVTGNSFLSGTGVVASSSTVNIGVNANWSLPSQATNVFSAGW